MKFGFRCGEVNMVFSAVIEGEVKKEFEIQEIVAEEDSVISLANTCDMNVPSLGEIDTKISLLWDCQLFIV